MSPLTHLKKQALKVDPILTPSVRGIVDAVVGEAIGSSGKIDEEVARITTARMIERLSLMPRFLGVPMGSVAVVFDAVGIAFAGKRFRNQNAHDRRRQMEIWRKIPIGVFGDFLDFWQTMGVFVYFSTLEESEKKS